MKVHALEPDVHIRRGARPGDADIDVRWAPSKR